MCVVFKQGLNSEFEFKLLSNPEGAFAVGSSTGEVTVIRAEKIDRESHDSFELRVSIVQNPPGTLPVLPSNFAC